MKDNSRNFNLILLLILFVGLVLRFWRFWEIPFIHDELSAMGRLQFDSFEELIRQGVMIRDTHPAGVQVFLYYWVGLVGEGEFVVKLPFLLAGSVSIYLSYIMGKLWFNKTTGLLTAVYISSIQLTVMYSQIARPYVSGLMLTLLMVLYWSKYFFEGNKVKHLLLFILFASLSTYNHHFSLLFAAIVGLTGLVFVTKKNYLPYVLSGVAILILYIPHLPIFFTQLGVGGVGGWLNKPGPYFLFEFLNFLLHFSPYTWIVLLTTIVIVVFSQGERLVKTGDSKKRIVLLLWFFVPIGIGFSYSVLINPVLQYSMLIFSTPYLFLLLFSWAKNISAQRLTILVSMIFVVNISSLVWGRQYFEQFYKQAHEEVVRTAVEIQNEQAEIDAFIIDDYIPYYNDYYLKKYNKEIPYYTVRNKSISTNDFRNVVQNINSDVLVVTALKSDYFQLIKESFPYVIDYTFGFTMDQYTFAKKLSENDIEIHSRTISTTDFSEEKMGWEINREHLSIDTFSGSTVFHMKPGLQYGPGIKLPLTDIGNTRYLFIDIHAQIKSLNSENNASIVTVIKKGKETLFWKAMNFSEFDAKEGEWTNIYLGVDLLTAIGQKEDVDNCTFETFVWNPNDIEFYVNQFDITSRPGNPYRYSLFYDIKD